MTRNRYISRFQFIFVEITVDHVTWKCHTRRISLIWIVKGFISVISASKPSSNNSLSLVFFDICCSRFFQSGQFLQLLCWYKIQDEARATYLLGWSVRHAEYSNARRMLLSWLCSSHTFRLLTTNSSVILRHLQSCKCHFITLFNF